MPGPPLSLERSRKYPRAGAGLQALGPRRAPRQQQPRREAASPRVGAAQVRPRPARGPAPAQVSSSAPAQVSYSASARVHTCPSSCPGCGVPSGEKHVGALASLPGRRVWVRGRSRASSQETLTGPRVRRVPRPCGFPRGWGDGCRKNWERP